MTSSFGSETSESRRVATLLLAGTQRLNESGSPSARLDAELLLAFVLGTDRAGVLAHPELTLSPDRAEKYGESVRRRALGEPVAYIRGIKEFFGRVFMVDSRGLIPRPETELLVELAVARVRDQLIAAPRPAGTPPLLIADVGTGSGAIAVSVALECRRRGYGADVRLIASDADEAALGLARENGVGHAVADLVEFTVADLLPPADRRFDLLLANLPYVPTDEVPKLPVAASFEPRAALDGGPDGLTVIGRLLDQLPDRLAEGGQALLEIGSDQAERLIELAATKLPGWSVAIHPDLGGLPRVAELAPSRLP